VRIFLRFFEAVRFAQICIRLSRNVTTCQQEEGSSAICRIEYVSTALRTCNCINQLTEAESCISALSVLENLVFSDAESICRTKAVLEVM
jgi:hypothetical protein